MLASLLCCWTAWNLLPAQLLEAWPHAAVALLLMPAVVLH